MSGEVTPRNPARKYSDLVVEIDDGTGLVRARDYAPVQGEPMTLHRWRRSSPDFFRNWSG
jgi:hypothetical protein